MSIGADIAEVFEDVGFSFKIIRDGGDLSGEYMAQELSSQATKPLILEHFRRASFAYNTDAVSGDVVQFDTTGENYIVMNMLPEIFENEVASYESILYKCNIASGELYRPSGETWGNDYHKVTVWNPIKTNCYAMHVAALYGNELDMEEPGSLVGLAKNEVYIPHSVGISKLDRWQPASGEYYMVTFVETNRFPATDVAVVEEDNR